MKSIKELLEILLDHYENNRSYNIQSAGLCFVIIRLHTSLIIDQSDREALFDIIKANKPKTLWSKRYWWKPGNTVPRIKFLKKLIKNYEKY